MAAATCSAGRSRGSAAALAAPWSHAAEAAAALRQPAAAAAAAAAEPEQQQQQQQQRGQALLLKLPGEVLASIAAQLPAADDRARLACACKALATAAADHAVLWWGDAFRLLLPPEPFAYTVQPNPRKLAPLQAWLAKWRPAVHTLDVAVAFNKDWDYEQRNDYWRDGAAGPTMMLVLPSPPRECLAMPPALTALPLPTGAAAWGRGVG